MCDGFVVDFARTDGGGQAAPRLWTICSQQFSGSSQAVQDRHSNVHSNVSIVASAGEHAWICWIPCHSIDAAGPVALQSLDESAVFLVPNVDFRIYCPSAPFRTSEAAKGELGIPSLPLIIRFSSAPPNELLMTNCLCFCPRNRRTISAVSISISCTSPSAMFMSIYLLSRLILTQVIFVLSTMQ